MKRLIFVRHAKSSWKDASLRDSERPLNKRGIRDAPKMGELLRQEPFKVDQLVTSSAERARLTAEAFREALGMDEHSLRVERRIYDTFEPTIFQVVRELDDAQSTVALFGHNPTFTDLANIFSPIYIPNVPTCAYFVVEFDIESWQSFQPTQCRWVCIRMPKIDL